MLCITPLPHPAPEYSVSLLSEYPCTTTITKAANATSWTLITTSYGVSNAMSWNYLATLGPEGDIYCHAYR